MRIYTILSEEHIEKYGYLTQAWHRISTSWTWLAFELDLRRNKGELVTLCSAWQYVDSNPYVTEEVQWTPLSEEDLIVLHVERSLAAGFK